MRNKKFITHERLQHRQAVKAGEKLRLARSGFGRMLMGESMGWMLK